MKRTNCPKFFARTKVDNSGSCENTSTRNKIFIVTIFLKMHNAQLFASQASLDKKLSGCLVYSSHLSQIPGERLDKVMQVTLSGHEQSGEALDLYQPNTIFSSEYFCTNMQWGVDMLMYW